MLNFDTSHLSAYIKFGNVSIREVLCNIKEKYSKTIAEPFIRQLYWNNFYVYTFYHDMSLYTKIFPNPEF